MSSPRRPVDAPDERSLVSARLLVDLVTNTLDPGYAAAAKRRGPDTPRRWYEQPIVSIGCLLIGFMLVVAYVHTNRGAPQAQKVHDGLVNRVRSAQQSANDLSKELARVEKQLAAEQAKDLPASGALAQGLDRAKLAAGQTAVTGGGLVVTLREPPAATSTDAVGRGGTTSIGQTNILTDRDVRSVVNELWGDGAEAIAVNGVRLTPTSAIRFAGQAVLVDFQPITSPYRIEAIGNPNDLSTGFASSPVASRYQTLSGADHIGFTFTESTHLSLAASGAVTPRYATPLPSPTRVRR
ncbi:MAG: hypothetical protein JWR06_1078 [Jatrophihabitans sp.]|nr:hypothetical protein [Jatrophihabitans sp.]